MNDLNLVRSYNTKIAGAFIITLMDHAPSMHMAKQCLYSCEDVGQEACLWPAFDALTSPGQIKIPDRFKDNDWIKWPKLTEWRYNVVPGELACFMSHLSLWIHCINLDQPILILEQDAILLRKIEDYPLFGSILYLGCTEQRTGQMGITGLTPPFGSDGPNYLFQLRGHSYGISPEVATQLVANVLAYGITSPLDIFIRPEITCIAQPYGLCAYDNGNKSETTILGRR